jgi:hypothetical protein
VSASPKVLVVLVNTMARAATLRRGFKQVQRPVILVSTKACAHAWPRRLV